VTTGTTEGPRRLSRAEIDELRRWARAISTEDRDARLRAAALEIGRLADEGDRLRADAASDGWTWTDGEPARLPATLEQVQRARHDARALLSDGASDELRAAARAILLLCDDVSSFRPEWAAVPAEAAPPATGRRSGLLGRVGASPAGLLALILPAAVVLLAFVLARTSSPDLDPRGPAEGALLGIEALPGLELSIRGDRGELADARWKLDGRDVTGNARVAGGRSILRPQGLADGPHRVEVSVGGLAPWSLGSRSWTFTVDTTPPELGVPGELLQARVRMPFTLSGTVERGATLLVDGQRVDTPRATFAVEFAEPPVRPVVLVARDRAGNVTESSISVLVVPRRPAAPLRSVHVTADAWAHDALRAAVLALIDEGKINSVELDLKDESGVIGWDAPVALGSRIGAVRPLFDLGEAVDLLHARGVRVVGRLVAFRDPILADWAWGHKRRAMVTQTPAGKRYAGYGGFTNFADPAVREYNIDVAVAAARLGVDDILYDYVRRPDGPIETMVFRGLDETPEESIVSFLAETREALEPLGTFLGASVFGIAATRPAEIAQDVPAMAREVDYISPMTYPSHWAPGEYGVANPNAQPYDIVRAALEDFQAAVRGTGARVVPWIQDFSLGLDYGPEEVRAQLRAAQDAGIDEFLLWDPEVTYTGGALRPRAKLPATGTAPFEVKAVSPLLLEPNELGSVPVLMYHQILPDGGGDYDLTPKEFRDELERLYREGYRPITAGEYVRGEIDLPAGASPVVMTFDDATASQAGLLPNGEIDPETAVGIMLDFASTHPGFTPAATFYVNRDPFAAGERAGELARWLVANGFELANHTRDHVNLGELGPGEVQRQIVLGNRVIRDLLPGAEVTTMALPLGVLPLDPGLAAEGSWDGEGYAFRGVMLVGAEPAPSPHTGLFDPGAIPRIRSSPSSSLLNGSADWLDRLAADPAVRYVSDGDPDRVTFPEELADSLDPAYAGSARPY
jgi:hypothetical protein